MMTAPKEGEIYSPIFSGVGSPSRTLISFGHFFRQRNLPKPFLVRIFACNPVNYHLSGEESEEQEKNGLHSYKIYLSQTFLGGAPWVERSRLWQESEEQEKKGLHSYMIQLSQTFTGGAP